MPQHDLPLTDRRSIGADQKRAFRKRFRRVVEVLYDHVSCNEIEFTVAKRQGINRSSGQQSILRFMVTETSVPTTSPAPSISHFSNGSMSPSRRPSPHPASRQVVPV